MAKRNKACSMPPAIREMLVKILRQNLATMTMAKISNAWTRYRKREASGSNSGSIY